MPNVLDELVVQGVRNSLSQAIAHALSGTLSGAVGSLASHGLFGNLTFSDPNLANTVRGLQSQLPGTQAPPSDAKVPAPDNTIAPITVTAPSAPPPSSLGALGQVISGSAGTSMLGGGAGTDTVPTQAPTDTKDDNQVDPLTVQGKAPSSGISPAIAIPAGAAGLALLSTAGGGSSVPAAAPSTVDPITVTAPSTPPPTGLTPTQAGIVGGGAGVGAGALTGDGNAVADAAGGSQVGDDVAAGATGGGLGALLDKTGLSTKDLVAGGILGAGLLSNGLGGSGDGAGGDAGGKLADVAANASGLADRLGQVATAGMAGDIGGRGLNSIEHMVRKAQAAVRQRYASMGMSGSTAEGQDLQAAADAGVDLQFKVGQEMAQTGLNAIAALTGQSAAIYTQLLNAQTAKDTALGNALANFAGALVR